MGNHGRDEHGQPGNSAGRGIPARDSLLGPRAAALGRVVTALVATIPLVGMGFVGMAGNWPVPSADPDLAGSVAGVWFFAVVTALALVGGMGLALNKVWIGAGFLLGSTVLLAVGVFL